MAFLMARYSPAFTSWTAELVHQPFFVADEMNEDFSHPKPRAQTNIVTKMLKHIILSISRWM